MEQRPPRLARPVHAWPTVHILVAEDDCEMRELLAEYLKRDGYAVSEAANGRELLAYVDSAFVQCASPAIDLLLTDVHMPEYSGLEIALTLRTAGLRAPIVVMSAFADEKTRARATELRAFLLDKPFKLAHLGDLVRRIADSAPGRISPSVGED